MKDEKSRESLLRPATPSTPTVVVKPKWPDEKSPSTPPTPASVTSNKPQWPKAEPDSATTKKAKKTIWKRIQSALGHVAIIVFLAAYTAAGGVAFRYLERPNEVRIDLEERQKYNATRHEVLEKLVVLGESFKTSKEIRDIVEEKLLEFQEAVIRADQAGIDLNSSETESKWKFGSSFFFAATVVTTIGYGNIAPLTMWGRIFCIAYALLGIPLTLIAIGDMGKLFASLVKAIGKLVRKYICPRKKTEDHDEPNKPESAGFGKTTLRVLGAIVLLLIYIALGAAMFCVWEEWSYFDSFYFCFITMTTIGLGDIVPEHQMYMMLCTSYILIGLAVTSTCIELARSEYEKSWQRMLDASRKLHGISLADTLRKLNDQIETHGEIVDFSIMKDIRQAIKGMGHPIDAENNSEPRLVVYESNI